MRYIIYGHHQCPWCDKAKDLLDTKGLSYRYINILTNDEARADITRMGHRTVPQVFLEETKGVDKKHIGGFEKLKEYLEKPT